MDKHVESIYFVEAFVKSVWVIVAKPYADPEMAKTHIARCLATCKRAGAKPLTYRVAAFDYIGEVL